MDTLFWILLTTFGISLISFIGVFTLFLKEEFLNKIIPLLAAFAAGSLLGNAFLHLVPEAIIQTGMKEDSLSLVFLYLISGFCVFFILEQFISWHHHHSTKHPEIKSFSYLILISDGVHNFIDGLTIAASFIIAFPLGVVTSLAIVFHEIPQEIGDFGVLIYSGFGRKKALFLNFLSAIIAILGGISGFFISEKMDLSVVFLLPFAAGNFIYIASSDIIPEIKQKESIKKSLIYFSAFLTGILIMFLMRLFNKI